MNVGDYIKELRTAKGISQEELGKVVGVKRAAVQKWEHGTVQNLKRTTIKKLAEYFNVSPICFIDAQYPTPNITEDYTTFPVIGEIAAGYNHIAIESWEGETVDIPNSYLRGRSYDEFIVLSVKGDSMYPLYHDGDKVLILKQTTLNHSGDIGAIIYDDEIATIKKIEYVKGENWLRLIPLNPSFMPETIDDERLERCRVIGIPKLLIREIK